MDIQTFSPGVKCAFLINRYLFLSAKDVHENIEDRFIPDGSIAFVFNFSGAVTVSDATTTYLLPPSFIVIPSSQSLIISTYPPLDTMVVHCKASIFTRLFNISISPPHKKPFIDAADRIPLTLWEKIKKTPEFEKRKQIFETFLLTHMKADYIPDDIDASYNLIMNSRGEEQVNKLLKNIDLNPRSFRRQFLARTGLSAKSLSRIVRINYLWNCFLLNNRADFQSMVYDANYHDQSHLINDFKKIIGESPSHFFKRELSNTAFLSGKTPQTVS